MARQQPADYLPPEVLARPEFIAACDAQDLGEIFRVAKRWGGVGFTASHLARRCGMTVSRVQDYVRGDVKAGRYSTLERVADALHIPGNMLHLASRPWETETDRNVVDANPLPASDGTESVLRRDFMKLGAGFIATGLVSRIPGMPSGTAGNRLSDSTVLELRSSISRLRHLDDHLGGADTYELYNAEVLKTEKVLEDGAFTEAIRRDLLTLLAEQAQQAGWAAFDAGWHADAKDLYGRSFRAAQEAGNAPLAANALALRSYQLLALGDSADDLTDKSLVIAAKADHPAVKSLLYQRGAWTYAMSGRANDVARALGHAENALSSADTGVAGPEWATWAHNSVELQIIAGRCWTQLHRPLRAVPALEAAMAQYDDSHARDKALYLSWLADAYLDAGEPEPAVVAVDHAMNLAANVASARPQQRLNVVRDRLKEHSTAPGVAELLARGPLNPLQVGR